MANSGASPVASGRIAVGSPSRRIRGGRGRARRERSSQGSAERECDDGASIQCRRRRERSGARERHVGDGERGEVRQRPQAEAAGVVERGVDRLQRRAEGEQRRDDADRRRRARGRPPRWARARGTRSAGRAGRPAATRPAPRAPARRSPRPSAPKAERRRPRARPATAAKRPQSSETKSADAADHHQRDRDAHAGRQHRPSPPAAPVRDTSPRTSRAKACSSRSSASMPEPPAARVTNMSDMVTDDRHGEGVQRRALALDDRRLTFTGWPTAASTVSERSRLSMASWAKSRPADAARLAPASRAAACVSAALERRLGRLEPEDVERRGPGWRTRRPSSRMSQVLRRDLGQLVATAPCWRRPGAS